MNDELKARALKNGRVEFLMDDAINILYEDNDSWILEEKGVGIICIAADLDEAVDCISDNAFGTEIEILDDSTGS